MSETPEELSFSEPAKDEAPSLAPEAPAPKRRGRPRKKPVEETTGSKEPEGAQDAPTPVEEAPAPKRRPGRPRKKPVVDESVDAVPGNKSESTEETAEIPAPKKAAAKRASSKKAASQEGAPKADASDKSDAEVSESGEKPAKRRPGRPRKKPAEEPSVTPEVSTAPVFDDAATPEELARILEQAKAEQSGDEPEKPAPKRRGRPRKKPVEQDSTQGGPESDEAQAKEQPSSEGVGPKPQSEGESKRKAATPDAPAEEAEASDALPASRQEGESGGRRKRVRRDDQGESRERRERGGRDDSSKGEGRGGNRREKFEQRKKDKRDRNNNANKPQQPKTSREELAALKVAELRAKADELGVEHKGLLKAALVEAVYEAAIKAEGFIEVEGILDIMPDGFGFVRTNGYLSGPGDAYVHASMVRRNHLRKGDKVKGQTRPARRGDKFPALQTIASVNDKPVELSAQRPRFANLTPVFPDERLVMEHGKSTITARVIDLVAPIGKGQRGLIVSPPKAGKTTVLKNIAAAIAANNPEVHLMCLLIDERPEEVTDMQRSIHGEVIASTFDMPCENHINCAEMVIERAKRLVEEGQDVVILLDSLTRLARAYNLAQPASGRILSGGVDSTALYPPKKFLGAARNIEGGGSLTILASALVETGSKMDEVIFEEFKGTGNMELKLDRQLAERRIFPAIDPVASGTRREDLLLDPQEAPLIWGVRRILSNRNNTERAMDTLIKSLHATRNNQEFLMRTAKKAQGRSLEENVEL
ncbi:MAG: transcription termination factor Rho [Coriobacteriia bacterium]|nr:transcription termination factor Rho [Coriobacteriia bacterium]